VSQACERPLYQAGPEEIRQILAATRTIAVVGLSDNPDKDSHRVADYLQRQGYRIIPVNPNATEILGEKCHASLREVTETVDLVNIFRKPEAVPAIVAEAIAKGGVRAVWMQSGIVHNAAAQEALKAGLRVVMNRCIMVEHRNLPPDP
jgi:predicted CoA-binding protein